MCWSKYSSAGSVVGSICEMMYVYNWMHNALDDSVGERAHEWIAGVESWIKKNNVHNVHM